MFDLGVYMVGNKSRIESLTPFLSAGLRFSIASNYFIYNEIHKIEIQKDKLSVRLYFIMGIFSFVFPFGLVYWGEQYVPSGLTSVLFAVYPFFVLLFSYFLISSETIGFYKFRNNIGVFGDCNNIFG